MLPGSGGVGLQIRPRFTKLVLERGDAWRRPDSGRLHVFAPKDRRDGMRPFVFVLSFLALSAGCSSESPGGSLSTDGASPDAVEEEAAAEEVLDLFGWSQDAEGVDSPHEWDTTGAAPWNGIGLPCADNSECPGGYCIDVLSQNMCTATCIEECPPGWSCRGLTLYGQDVQFVCVPGWFDQCSACSTHDDCGAEDDYCLPMGEGETFCTTHCLTAADCPADHVCLDVLPGLPEGAMPQCVPVSGSCACLDGKVTAEVCNGLDDDCDGEVDEGDVVGCIEYFVDQDADGFGVEADADCACFPHDSYTALLAGDCDDSQAAVHPGAEEVCNFFDDDCDEAVDEGVSSTCGNCDPGCHELVVGPGGDEGFSFGGADSTGVTVDGAGELSMGSGDGLNDLVFTFIWIANSAEDSVSKLDTKTGVELARYRVCSNPSRTSVDMYGDVWVACRGYTGQAPGGVAHIAGSDIRCKDKDQDGALETSKDLDGDGKIGGSEILDKGKDECVLVITDPSAAGHEQKSLAVDKYNNPWVGDWVDWKIRKLDPATGQVVEEVDASPTKPYGLVVDGNGLIWISGHKSCNVGKLDPVALTVQHFKAPDCSGILYGIAVDWKGDIWAANMEKAKVYHFHTDTQQFTQVPTDPALGYVRGVAASADGLIYVGHHTPTCAKGRSVSVIDASSDKVVNLLQTAATGVTGPTGVALDYQGMVWAVNQCADSATKIDPETGEVLGTFPVGDGPYTYSDMTGYSLHTFASPEAVYNHVLGSVASSDGTTWTVLDIDMAALGTSALSVRVRAAATVTQLAVTKWSDYFGPFPPLAFPFDLKAAGPFVGKYLEIELSLLPDDDANPVLVSSVTVRYQVEYAGE